MRYELDQARFEALERLAGAAESRDDGARDHPRRVARTTLLLARAIGIDEHEASAMGTASTLHDIGKIAIPDRVLLKPGRLGADERAIIDAHPGVGARILTGGWSRVMHMAAEIARTHHERWDGEGYPLGLQGEEIPLPGRIVAIADVFDALLHDRPYKRAWPVDRAVAEIRSSAGRHFDPDLVEAFAGLDHARLAGPLQPGELAPAAHEAHPAAPGRQRLIQRYWSAQAS